MDKNPNLAIPSTISSVMASLPLIDSKLSSTQAKNKTQAPTRQGRICWHPDCEKHHLGSHPEQPFQVGSILQALRSHPSLLDNRLLFLEAPLTTKEQARLFHTTEHIANLEELLQKSSIAAAEGKQLDEIIQSIDSDTQIMPHHATYKRSSISSG